MDELINNKELGFINDDNLNNYLSNINNDPELKELLYKYNYEKEKRKKSSEALTVQNKKNNYLKNELSRLLNDYEQSKIKIFDIVKVKDIPFDLKILFFETMRNKELNLLKEHKYNKTNYKKVIAQLKEEKDSVMRMNVNKTLKSNKFNYGTLYFSNESNLMSSKYYSNYNLTNNENSNQINNQIETISNNPHQLQQNTYQTDSVVKTANDNDNYQENKNKIAFNTAKENSKYLKEVESNLKERERQLKIKDMLLEEKKKEIELKEEFLKQQELIRFEEEKRKQRKLKKEKLKKKLKEELDNEIIEVKNLENMLKSINSKENSIKEFLNKNC